MPEAQIYNAGSVWGQQSPAPNQYVEMVNNSASTLLAGDVVVFAADVTGVLVTTTTTANDKTVLGVVGAKIPSDSLNTQPVGNTVAVNAVTPVIIRGPARMNIGANAVAVGDLLTSSGTAKVGQTNAGTPAANAVTGSIIGIALEASTAKDANNTIRVYINK